MKTFPVVITDTFPKLCRDIGALFMFVSPAVCEYRGFFVGLITLGAGFGLFAMSSAFKD